MRAIPAMLLLSLLAGPPAHARPRHFWTDKKWWTGVAVIGAATALDGASTCQGLGRGGVETNLLIPGNPTCARVGYFMAGAFTFWTTIHAVDWHYSHDSPSRVERMAGLTAMPIGTLAVHLPSAIHNLQIPPPR